MTVAPAPMPEGRSTLGEKLIGLIIRSNKVGRLVPARLIGVSLVSVSDIVLLSVWSALCGAGLIIVLNMGAASLDSADSSVLLALLFLLLLIVHRMTEGHLLRKTAAKIEEALHQRRTRVMSKALQLDLRDMQSLKRTTMVEGIAGHYEAVSDTVLPLLRGFQSVILLAFILLYLCWQSLTAVALTGIVAALIVRSYFANEENLLAGMNGASRADVAMRAAIGEIVDGFKELRLDRKKQDEIRGEFISLSARVARFRSQCAEILTELMLAGDSSAYMLAGAIVFLLPILSSHNSADLPLIVTTVLFALAPLRGAVGSAQQLSAARFSLQEIEAFEKTIDARLGDQQVHPLRQFEFRSLEMRAVGYVHGSVQPEPSFAIQEVDLHVGPGELVFITGGNGSGKTTLLRVLTGLYDAHSGVILLNGEAVGPADAESYRHLFATVFADFHAFRKPYGLDEAGVERLRLNVGEVGIAQKLPADLSEGYDTQALSTGQRKRLALAVALAEKRPVLVLDEWAADQDPGYREHFYRVILPEVRASGVAIIAVTHDERYFDLADRRYHMEDGQLRPVNAL